MNASESWAEDGVVAAEAAGDGVDDCAWSEMQSVRAAAISENARFIYKYVILCQWSFGVRHALA